MEAWDGHDGFKYAGCQLKSARRVQEITRRVNLRGIWQAAYTAGVVLPKPVGTAQYWHRSLNPKKLISVGFSRLAVRPLCIHPWPACGCCVVFISGTCDHDLSSFLCSRGISNAQSKQDPAISLCGHKQHI